MKRILPLLLAAAMLLSLIPAVHAADIPDPAEETSTAAEPTAADETAAEPTDADASEAEPEFCRSEDDLAPTADAVIPRITRVTPSVNGVTLKWSGYDGAAKYFVFIKKDNGGWKKIGESTTESFEHKITANNTLYTYTVRAADKNGSFISGYDKEGFAYSCLATPVLNRVESVNAGQKLIWDAVDGAALYMVYISTGTQWEAIATTDKTYYVNKDVTSGKKYSYTVRCWDGEKRTARSFYIRKGITGTYIAAPAISSFTPVSGGVQANWKSVAGAPRYALFVKNGEKWKCVAKTDKTSAVCKDLKSTELYTFTVRCLDKNGAFCSGYDTKGVKWRYLANPSFNSITAGEDGLVLSWRHSPYVSAYRIYRKPFNGSWDCIGISYTGTFTDKTAAKNTLYTYTLRAIDENRRLVTHFTDTRTYYYNGALANGKIAVGGSSIFFSDGKVRQGYVNIDGKTYYFNSSGVMQKNGLVGSSKDGWRYADKNGVVQMNYTGLATNSAGTWYLKNGSIYRDTSEAITWNGTDYIIINGKAHEVSDEEEETLFRAIKLTNSVAPRSYSMADRLEIMFDYITGDVYTEMNPRLPDYTGIDWPIIYANDLLVDGEGNCLSYAAEFAFIAKAIGYDEVYGCHSGGHGWTEIDGLVYDPEWSMHNFNYSYYALSYYTQTDQDYLGAISPGYDWMHVKICAHL